MEKSRSQWPRGLRRRSLASRLLRLWVQIPPRAWMFVCCECCVLSGRGLCDGLITRPEESYRLWRVVVCDQETSNTRRLRPATRLWKYNHMGCKARKTNTQTRWREVISLTPQPLYHRGKRPRNATNMTPVRPQALDNYNGEKPLASAGNRTTMP
jgi:hypothetical protein